MVDPLKRLERVETLIKKGLYFTLHAPRQTGKTIYLHALARKLNYDGKTIALTVSFESAGYPNISVEKAERILLDSIQRAALSQLPEEYFPPLLGNDGVKNVETLLFQWCRAQAKPIVLLIDEIDALRDEVLISVLRQLRNGY